MHGAPIPPSAGKASLLLVCAHLWEARPYVDLLGLQLSNEAGYFPFPLYAGENVRLILTGTGRVRAAMAVSAWVSHHLRDEKSDAGSSLRTPPLVVLNFGTAGAYDGTWAVGKTLLVNKTRLGTGASLYPQRLIAWHGDEAECRTVDVPQRAILTEDVERGRKPLYDMEAFGVAEAVTTFLSSSHLVVGKCVLDAIGREEDSSLDLVSLKKRVEVSYKEGAVAALEHALALGNVLARDARSNATQEIDGSVDGALAHARRALTLTVTQERELRQALRGRAAGLPPGERRLELELEVITLLGRQALTDKRENKVALQRLLRNLASLP